MDGLTEDRIVHYVLPTGPRAGEHRAAIVTCVEDAASGLVSLNVQLTEGDVATGDSGHALDYMERPVKMATAHHDANGSWGTWHWIEKV